MTVLPPAYDTAVRALEQSALDGNGIPAKVKHLGIALAYSDKGRDAEAASHGRLALAHGLTRPEVLEGLMAGVLSRGVSMVSSNSWLVGEAPDGPLDIAAAPPVASDEILRYFDDNFGTVPDWLSMLATSSPGTLEAYYRARAEVLRDGALRRRDKELLLVIINCTERYDIGMTVHMRGALEAGALEDDVLEAARAAIVPGGMVAWLAGADAARQVFTARAG